LSYGCFRTEPDELLIAYDSVIETIASQDPSGAEITAAKLASQNSVNFLPLCRYLERAIVEQLDLQAYFDIAKALPHNTVNGVTFFLLEQLEKKVTPVEFSQILDIILGRHLIERSPN